MNTFQFNRELSTADNLKALFNEVITDMEQQEPIVFHQHLNLIIDKIMDHANKAVEIPKILYSYVLFQNQATRCVKSGLISTYDWEHPYSSTSAIQEDLQTQLNLAAVETWYVMLWRMEKPFQKEFIRLYKID